MTADLVIHHGQLVFPEGIVAASLAIRDGRILAMGTPDSMPDATETLDASGMHVLPGAIDVHVHFRDLTASEATAPLVTAGAQLMQLR